MSGALFDRFLGTPDMQAVFNDSAIVQAMLRFEEALSLAEAEEGLIPTTVARAIAGLCKASLFDIPALIVAGRRAGSLAIPLVQELTRTVALYDAQAATHVHWGSTSQDVIDTAMVLVTRDALALIDSALVSLTDHLLRLAQDHVATPVLARTLMQPAQVTSFGFKLAGWAAPLVRARDRLREAAQRALQLQLGGAVGTLTVLDKHGPTVAARMAQALGLRVAHIAWHTQRDEWVRLAMEIAVLTGSLGKIATDLSLMAQGEIAELAEPSGAGRGGSSAMPHKRNPVAAMLALAAANRAPQQAATLLACMGQQQERGLGNWQAELATWPDLFLGAHAALIALDEAFAGLQVDSGRMRRNIDALQGLVFAEAATIALAPVIGRPKAQALLQQLAQEVTQPAKGATPTSDTAVATPLPQLQDALTAALKANPTLRGKIDPVAVHDLFDADAAARPAMRLAQEQITRLRAQVASQSAPSPATALVSPSQTSSEELP